ncbi:uncharacterized protein LOC123870696 [Maniola jurtina]|uniref:uncharacterized protein LOC123870696 n=1 Tax=Maniola jurtina TaxID=191418 RepID=UPI001E68A02C|nr:uncharacterized protein LOC123870696 [Maniola jurtina]
MQPGGSAGLRIAGVPRTLDKKDCYGTTPNTEQCPSNPFPCSPSLLLNQMSYHKSPSINPKLPHTPHSLTHRDTHKHYSDNTQTFKKQMADLKTNFGLLVGSGSVPKSHPGTQATSTDGAQGPGCPTVSGGGKDPQTIGSTMMKTTTSATNMDMSSLAEAIPVPASASTWTLVAPKQRRKNKGNRTDRRTRKQTDTQADEQTDKLKNRPTDGRENGGGKRKEPDCPSADASHLAGGSKGGSEGRPPLSGGRPSADTGATPGCSAGEQASGQVSAPDRNPNASGKSSTTTVGAGQTAVEDRGNDGGHTDPDGNPIQTRGATGPGGSNTARPPTTTTTKTTSNKPTDKTDATKTLNPPKARARPRFRKRNRGQTKDRQDPGTSSSQTNKKRDRLDDTISPRGEHKRARTDDRHTRDAKGSYATAAQSHLSVAVTTTPRVDLTQDEANAIQAQIQKAIFAACIEPLAPGQTRYAPAFEGKAFLSEGVLKMWCHDDQACNWLINVVPKLTSPRSGTGLTVIKQTEIPVRVRSGLYVPDYDGEIGQLHQVLSHQNPWYGVSQWTLFSYRRTTSSPPGVFLILGIPNVELPTILARGRKVAYSTGSIYIRFFTSEGLSDVPPGHDSAPETREEPDADRSMDVDGPTGQLPVTPEPSVSAVLDNIEEVLADSRINTKSRERKATHNAPDATAPAEQPPAQRATK